MYRYNLARDESNTRYQHHRNNYVTALLISSTGAWEGNTNGAELGRHINRIRLLDKSRSSAPIEAVVAARAGRRHPHTDQKAQVDGPARLPVSVSRQAAAAL